MSIAVLKRKSNRFKSVVSGKGTGGFSINGGLRNQGWVGQDTLGRHLNGTPFRGVEPMGNGGSGGKYVRSIVNSGSCCANDPKVIKRSTLNTSGYINATITHPTGVFNEGCTNLCSKKWVKNFSPLDHSQSSHITHIKRRESKECEKSRMKETDVKNNNEKKEKKEKKDCDKKGGCNNKHLFYINGKRFYIVNNTKTKNKVKFGPVSSGEYNEHGALHSKCLPPPPNKAPFPMKLHHDGCDINYLTPEAAIEGGALPNDWMT